MGVKGLTSFIAKHAEKYLEPFELHDCNLVIDGDSLACNLFKDVSECNSAFSGDYDKYYRTVTNFFQLLIQCNIKSFVLLDGGYERKKIQTVQSRLRSKIGCIKYINPSNSKPLFPIMMREVFVDALKDCEIPYMRCVLEADEELAALGKTLNCPVLSYDSDFYVYDVKYIPLITLRLKVLEKHENKLNKRHELRACEARNLKKKQKVNSGISIDTKNDMKNQKFKLKTVKYLDCCLYRIENLLEKSKLDKEKIPLFAALLGNDYIHVRLFRNFYSQVSMKGISNKIPNHQKRVMVIIKWLRHETKESAIEKIIARMKKEQRKILLKKIETATNGYKTEHCISFSYFNLTENDVFVEKLESEDLIRNSDNSELEEFDSACSENGITEEELTSSENENDFNKISENNGKSDSNEDKQLRTDVSINSDILFENTDIEKTKTISNDILERINSAAFPRYVSDLLNLRLYINNPQVENFLYPDCNEIAIPILLKIFAYLHYPEKPELKYLTRVVRLTNCIYKKFPIDHINLKKENVLEDIFASIKINLVDLNTDLLVFPSDIRYYLISLIYWANQSEYCDEYHIHSILICLVTLRFIDFKTESIRNEKLFYKVHGKKIQKEKQTRNKITEESSDTINYENNYKINKAKEVLKEMSIYKKINYIPKIEKILLQENLLKNFSYHEDNRNAHTTFSSTTIHSFSQFQSVLYQMYTLNALLNYSYEQIKMSNLYCGLFLYNIYVSLQQRIDLQHYIKNFIFRNSEITYDYYQTLCKLCEKYISSFELSKSISILESNKDLTKKLKKKLLKKEKKYKKPEIAIKKVDQVDSSLNRESNDDDFNILNNKFGMLSV